VKFWICGEAVNDILADRTAMFGLLKTTRVVVLQSYGSYSATTEPVKTLNLKILIDGSLSVSIDDVSPDSHPGWGGARPGARRQSAWQPILARLIESEYH
jgi:hypothetical protein